MQEISFQSKLRPVKIKEFTDLSADIYTKAHVRYPWTSAETIKAEKACTTDILDCTAGGIIDENGKNVVLFHICPTQAENRDFEVIENNIMKFVDLASGKLRAFLIGSQNLFFDSEMMFKRLYRMLVSRDIPTSIIKGSKGDKTDILYDAAKDEWVITNFSINARLHSGETDYEKILKELFDEVKISKGDEL